MYLLYLFHLTCYYIQNSDSEDQGTTSGNMSENVIGSSEESTVHDQLMEVSYFQS